LESVFRENEALKNLRIENDKENTIRSQGIDNFAKTGSKEISRIPTLNLTNHI